MSIEIIAREPRDETRQVAYITIKDNSDEFPFSVGDVPAELETDNKVKNYLKDREEEFLAIIKNEESWDYKFPKWIDDHKKIDEAPIDDNLKALLKDIA